ncbi:MAG: 2-dehydropantoate 2-reductase [Microthrixaceae bacterium]
MTELIPATEAELASSVAAPARIAIVGCGAMGSVYAARLAEAGHEVTAISRRADHIDAIETAGLRISGPDGERVVRLRASQSVPEEPMDLVVVAVKAAGVAGVAETIGPLIDQSTVVLALQNGLGSSDALADRVGPDRLAVGIASGFGASIREAGHVHHNAMRAIRFGAYGGLNSSDLGRVAEIWRSAGFDAGAVEDIVAMQWEKLMCNVAYSAPCALTGLTVGQVMDHPEMGAVSRAAATEAWETALALGVECNVDDPVALVVDFASQMPNAKPSALLDLEAGRVSEISFINGAVPREAAKVGRDAPVNATLTALVRTREESFGS